MDRQFCSAIAKSDIWRSYRCAVTAKVERDGKWYCGRHDPVAVSQKRAKRQAKMQERFDASIAMLRKQIDAEEEQKRRAECYDDLLAALQTAARYAYNEGNDEEISQVASAIAKATGEQP